MKNIYGTEILDRINELEDMIDGAENNADMLEERYELNKLNELVDGLGGSAVRYMTFIHDSNIVEFAKEFAEEAGLIKRDTNWPYNHIDWNDAADELMWDFTVVEIDGETYYCQE